MRNQNFNIIHDAINLIRPEIAMEIYKRACICRFFELYLQDLMKKRDFKMPIYLSLGHEFSAASVSVAYPECAVFAQHRGHSWYLSYGGDIRKLIDELLGLETGCCKGMGGSPCIQDQNKKYFGHSGLLGDQVPIAVGYAIGCNDKVLSVFGDAAAEEDYVLASIGFAQTKKLPVLFVCEDNNLSILTTKDVRRSWDGVSVSQGFGMGAYELADDPWNIFLHINNLNPENYPYYMNILVCRKLWHVGCGQDAEPEWDRFDIVEKQLDSVGLLDKAISIKESSKIFVESIWEEQLQKL